MSKLRNAALLVLLLGASATANAAGGLCFTDQTVTAVNTGYVNTGRGPDNGEAVFFTLGNGKFMELNNAYNLDHERGRALHRVLLLAFAGRFRITGYDHYGGTCDDIDEIRISR